MIFAEHVIDISCIASNVNIVTAYSLNQIRSCPHADAPRIARIGVTLDLVVPLHVLLVSDLPEIL